MPVLETVQSPQEEPASVADEDSSPPTSSESIVPKEDPEKSDGKFHSLYEMKTQFAKGSYGTVWITSPKSQPDEEYAVKVIDRSCLKEKDRESVFREVQIMKELQDLPHVIPLVDFIVEPNYLYMIQFYARGGDLFRRLTQRKQYTEKDARDIAIILFQTLDDMHTKHNVVHRDLKPENLLLEDLVNEKIFFADFGFARHVTEGGLQTRCGTPAFVAPEILVGARYNTQADNWSIGVILFMMLGGYPPFHMEGGGSDLRLLFHKIRAGDFTFHESLWRTVSPEAKRLIARLLTVNPDYRCTARQALESDWVKKVDAKDLSNIDLSSSLTTLRKFDGRLSLKSAMNAVKFAVSASFFDADTITFSRQTRNIVLNDSVVDAVLSGPGKAKFEDVYEITRVIRKGACATVYECRHKGTQESFSVKIVRRAKLKASEDEFVMNEVSIMQTLSKYGKYVVQLLDFYEEEEFFYLVMDYMGGGDVFDRLLKKNKYTEDDARHLTKLLLKAIRCMHSAGVAHRDLKPQNLLLKSEDDDVHVKVTDFGFARRVHTPQSLTSRCGTPTFVACEILKNIPHDESCDMWSVGVIVYLLLVGYPPFVKDTQAELFQQIRSADWRFQEKDWENISKDAQELIQNLLVADPEQRWTAEEALKCAWIEDETNEGSNVDLMGSIESLRERRARLRPASTPVEGSPVDANIKKQDDVLDGTDFSHSGYLT